MKRAVIYSRVSSKHQDYNRQIRDLESYAKSKEVNLEIVETFEEKISATGKGKELKDRAAFSEMKEFIKKEDIKMVLMWEISRLARSTANALVALEELKKDNVNVFFFHEGKNSLITNDWLHITIHCAIAEDEAIKLSARVKSGRKRSVDEGTVSGYYGQNLPYGYESVKKSADEPGILTVNDKESKVILKIFNWAVGIGEVDSTSVSLRKISDRLNTPPHKVPTRGNLNGKDFKNKHGKYRPSKWTPTTIAKILRNPLYKGERNVSFGEKEEDKISKVFPEIAIVSESIWKEAQTSIRKVPPQRFNAVQHKYLLKGKIQCGNKDCGRTYGAFTESRYGIKSFYRCYGRTYNCDNGQMSGTAIENGVYMLLFQYKDVFSKMREDAIESFNLPAKQEELETYRSQLSEGIRMLKKMAGDYNAGHYLEIVGADKINPTTDERREATTFYRSAHTKRRKENDELKIKISSLEERIEVYKSMVDSRSGQAEISIYESDNYETRLDFVEKFLNKVVLHNIKETDIDFNNLIWYKMMNPNYFERIDSAFKPDTEEVTFNQPNGKDKIAYVEIYAFYSPYPICGLISSVSKLYCHTKDYFKVEKDGLLEWDNRPSVGSLRADKQTLLNTKNKLEYARKNPGSIDINLNIK